MDTELIKIQSIKTKPKTRGWTHFDHSSNTYVYILFVYIYNLNFIIIWYWWHTEKDAYQNAQQKNLTGKLPKTSYGHTTIVKFPIYFLARCP